MELLSQLLILCALLFLAGLIDGVSGGGGTVALMLFTLVFGYDMRTASGNGKVVIVVLIQAVQKLF